MAGASLLQYCDRPGEESPDPWMFAPRYGAVANNGESPYEFPDERHIVAPDNVGLQIASPTRNTPRETKTSPSAVIPEEDDRNLDEELSISGYNADPDVGGG